MLPWGVQQDKIKTLRNSGTSIIHEWTKYEYWEKTLEHT